MAEYQLEKDSSLTWCQTAARGALMTVDSTTEVDVGMDMLFGVSCGVDWVCLLRVLLEDYVSEGRRNRYMYM